jgi:threonine/homoserine/homoserine lactone efflux protein
MATFLVSQQGWIHIIGGLFLVYLGIKTVFTRPAERAASARADNFLGAYASTLLLTLTNPQTILSFAAIYAGIGVGGGKNGALSATLVVSGVFLGSTLWWCLLTAGISLLRGNLTYRWFLWINRIAGSVIILFGLLALLSLKR